jgi:hypothetical protein
MLVTVLGHNCALMIKMWKVDLGKAVGLNNMEVISTFVYVFLSGIMLF